MRRCPSATARSRDKCTKKVKEIMQGDITLLFVTHSPEIAKAFAPAVS